MRRSGFSLIEFSIVLLIMSVALGMVLGVVNRNLDLNRKEETERKLAKATKAIAEFVAKNGRLPCPAIGKLEASEKYFGAEQRDASFNCIQDKLTYSLANSQMVMGVLPVRTLQLPDEFIFDAWGGRFMYYIVDSCAQSDNEAANGGFSSTADNKCGGSNPEHHFTIENFSNQIANNEAIYVLLSYGPNQHGAIPASGGTKRLTSRTTNTELSEGELLNSSLSLDGTNQLVRSKFIQQAWQSSPYYDDILLYRTRAMIRAEAGFTSLNDNLCQEITNYGKETISTLYCYDSNTECNSRVTAMARALALLCR